LILFDNILWILVGSLIGASHLELSLTEIILLFELYP